jgi:signal transduction histidine kinase
LFFVPVVYAAYSVGVIRAVLVALASMVILMPYSILTTNQPGAFFRPTAFVLIMSAVGAVVAMLQKGDEQRKRSLNEMKCLFDIGKSTENAITEEKLISTVLALIPQDLNFRGTVEVCITLRGKVYGEPITDTHKHKISEDLVISGEPVGKLEIAVPPSYPMNNRANPFIKTLAERISGAIHSIELEQNLNTYYEQLEIMVENRTRELEQAQEKLIRSERLAAVGELASGVGHELRNPLNVIRNCVYLINMNLDGQANAEVEDTLKLLDLQVDISNKIVSDLLDFTRVKPPTRNIVNLNSMVQDRVAWASIPDKVTVKYHLASETPELFIDPEQVGRAFTNIINNAVQSMTAGGELSISTGTDDDTIAWVKFADTGCGIPAENLTRVFEPLFTTKPKGIGLGLAITKRMVEQNNGEIEVESTVGKGTAFTLRLPLIKKEVTQYETAGLYTGR